MFKKIRIIIFLAGVLLVAMTVSGVFCFTEESQRIARLWYLMGGVFVAEACLTLSFMDIGVDRGETGYLYRFLNPVVSILYLVFAGGMLFTFPSKLPDHVLLFAETAALFFVLICFFLVNMGSAAATEKNGEFQKRRSNSRLWEARLTPLEEPVRQLCRENSAEKFQALCDAVRWVPDSIGTESEDLEITAKLEHLESAIQEKKGESAMALIEEIGQLLRKRSALSKRNR